VHRESFGLPICELQACGAFVAAPYSNWTPSHWIKNVRMPGAGTLTPNFIVYDNDLEKLKQEIERIKSNYDAANVRETFLREQPSFFYGNLDALQTFIDGVAAGTIHSHLHKDHTEINSRIVSEI
jgi:glycosyltransferase involved in cell wall biosynthesis